MLQHENITGPVNAVAPNPVTNFSLMKQLAQQRHRLFIPIGVPAFLLKAILGEMALVTLEGSRISPEKLIGSGFEFQHLHPLTP